MIWSLRHLVIWSLIGYWLLLIGHLSGVAVHAYPNPAFLTSYQAYPTGSSPSPTSGWWERIASLWNQFLGLRRIRVGQKAFTVEVVDTDVKRTQGLSSRQTLGEGRGMIFVFDRPDQPSFWMADMLFPLDFIWIRGGQVVELTANVPPPDQTLGQPRVITPTVKVDQVLEVSAGAIDKYGIKVGDIIRR